MTINEIKVNTVRLKKDASDINSYINDMEKKLSDMEESLNQMNKMWEGEVKNAFAKSVNDDIEVARIMIKELLNLCSYEKNAGLEYDKCEQKVADIIKSIRV